jgi:hypothetical protein
MSNNIREQLNEVLYQESVKGHVKDVGNFLMRGAGYFNPVIGMANKLRDNRNKSKTIKPEIKPKVKPITNTDNSSKFTSGHAVGGVMAATALGLGAKHLYNKYKKNKEKKKFEFKGF